MNIFFSYLSRCIKAGSCPTCNPLLNLLSRLDTPLYTEGLEEWFWQVRSTAERVVYAERVESPPQFSYGKWGLATLVADECYTLHPRFPILTVALWT
jgi:hypothetical protein